MRSKSSDRYVIVCTSMLAKQEHPIEGMPLFWSNKLGWVTLSGADVFTIEDTTKLNLPLEGDWVMLPTALNPETASGSTFSDAYAKGKEACASGISMSTCPHLIGSVEEMCWCTGWLVANQDSKEG